jgi:predicted nuclease of predicted toxin-antitoxin system
MRLYLDHDTAAALLDQTLRRAGHEVQIPVDAGLAGQPDPVHLRQAIHDNRVLLSRDHRDFVLLHALLGEARGHHPGILVIRRDNDPRRNMTPRDVVRALRNLEAASVPIANEYIVLNAWQ